MFKKIQSAFYRSSTIDKMWVTSLVVGCLLVLFFIWKTPKAEKEKPNLEKEKKEKLMM